MRKRMISCFLTIFISLTYLFKPTSLWATNFEKDFNRVINQASKQLEKKYSVTLVGTGGSVKDKVITTIATSYSFQGNLNKDQVRKLLINMQEDFYQSINQNSAIKSYLNSYPFDKTDIVIDVFFYNSDQNLLFYPDIGVAGIIGDTLSYVYKDPNKKYAPPIKEEKETYEEALKAFQANNSKESL